MSVYLFEFDLETDSPMRTSRPTKSNPSSIDLISIALAQLSPVTCSVYTPDRGTSCTALMHRSIVALLAPLMHQTMHCSIRI